MIIKGQNSELLEINILRRENHHTADYWDANWLNVQVKVEVPNFRAHYATNLRTDDFQRFYDDIMRLKDHKISEVEFTTMEEGLYLNLKLQKTGSLLCAGKTDDHSGNELEFQFTVDNIMLDSLADQLKMILKKYPVIGSPE